MSDKYLHFLYQLIFVPEGKISLDFQSFESSFLGYCLKLRDITRSMSSKEGRPGNDQ
jgi:hypothetical protein